ncbi:MAG: hypothetical protein KDD94_08595 [Calditrichaeota bacterium]|nr:hypothetical protein [Calditrichota bacterium]
MYEVFSQQAQDLISHGEYQKALQILKTIWKSRKDAHIADQIMYCIIELGYWREGSGWIETFERQYAKDVQLQERINRFKSEKAIASEMNKGDIHSIANETIESIDQISDSKRRNDLINQLIFKAKQANDWDTALDWFNKVDLTALNKKGGDKSISDLQKYYLNAHDIFIAMNDFKSLYEQMKKAVSVYPNYFAFVKAFSLALIQTEKYDEASHYLNEIIDWEKPKWFLVEQLAIVLFRLGEIEESWKLACRSFNTKIDQKYKTDLHLTMMDIAKQLNLNELSGDIGILTILVRTENNIEIPEHLFELLKEADPELTIDKILKRHHDAIQDGIHWGVERFEGVITYYPPNQNFARLRYGNKKSALINKSDLDDDCHYEGARITFIEKKIVDKKTGKESVFGKLGRKLHKLETI